MSEDVWPMVRAERAVFADYLDTLGPDDWAKPSACAGWSVKDVVGHILEGAESTPVTFFPAMVRARFDFDRMNENGVASRRGVPPSELVTRFRSAVDHKNRPLAALLGEVIVHGEDVRRPLGSPARQYPAAHLRAAAEHYKTVGAPVNAKKRIAGVKLQATDTDWSTGDGALARGPLLALVLAMTGRKQALADVDGPGADVLRGRP